MRRRRWSEEQAIELLEGLFAGPHRSLLVGIGDDAAVIASPRSALVLSIDACVENVHFDRRWLSLEDVGWRATQAAVSDLAAMGAAPLAGLCNLSLPSGFGRRDLSALARGQAQAAENLGCPLVGGNLTRAVELSLTTAVVGSCRAPLLRSGARAGDELWCIGELGLAAAGLAWLRTGKKPTGAARRCVMAWRRPRALVAAGRALAGRARACCDVSDGLARDAAHLAEASEVRVVIEEGALLRTLPRELWETAERLRISALDLALGGGEDYALLCTGPAERRPRRARRIGRVVRGRGVVLETKSGRLVEPRGGYDHLR